MAQDALLYGASLIRPGASMRDVLDKVEAYIRAQGCAPAFPAQSCVNHIAAHYCPTDREDYIYQAHDLVKLDVGVHADGHIGDNALTLSLDGTHEDLIAATKAALADAERLLKPGVTPHIIGAAIERAITERGFQPVRNLTGHGLQQWVQHAPPSIPNYPAGDHTPLEPGMVIAIEPFATDGSAGMITTTSDPTLFSLGSVRPVRTPHARAVLQAIEKYNGLPFTTRWLTQELGARAALGIAELRRAGILEEYAPLPERSKGLVAQHEHTFLITEDGFERLTSPTKK